MPPTTPSRPPRRSRWSRLGGLLALGSLIPGCAAAQVAHPAHHRAARPPAPLLAREGLVDTLLSQMTLAQKVGQMTQADQEFLNDPAHSQRYPLGSLLSCGNSY